MNMKEYSKIGDLAEKNRTMMCGNRHWLGERKGKNILHFHVTFSVRSYTHYTRVNKMLEFANVSVQVAINHEKNSLEADARTDAVTRVSQIQQVITGMSWTACCLKLNNF